MSPRVIPQSWTVVDDGGRRVGSAARNGDGFDVELAGQWTAYPTRAEAVAALRTATQPDRKFDATRYEGVVNGHQLVAYLQDGSWWLVVDGVQQGGYSDLVACRAAGLVAAQAPAPETAKSQLAALIEGTSVDAAKATVKTTAAGR